LHAGFGDRFSSHASEEGGVTAGSMVRSAATVAAGR
jgi:hypothetical protein